MLYILLILFPIVMAASSFILRKRATLTVAVGIAALVVQMALVALIPVERPVRLLSLTLLLDPLGRVFLLGMLAMSVIAFLASRFIPHGENFITVALLIIGVCGVMLLLQEPFTVTLLLVSAGVMAVLAIVDMPTGSAGLVGRAVIAAALKYLVLMVMAGVVMFMGFVLITIYQPGTIPGRVSPAQLTLALLVVGFGLRLAVIPFHSWLPDLAEHAAPMVSAMVIVVINTTSLLFLLQSLVLFPIIMFENGRGVQILMTIGVVAAVLGAILALAQVSMRRVVGYLLVYNAGMMLFGIAAASPSGVAGALFEAFSEMIATTLIFLSLAMLERPDGRPPNVVRHDLLWRWPVAGMGLLGGGITLLGLPPLGGFVGKLLLYQAAMQQGGGYLAALLLATFVAALALTRMARERLFGAPEELPQDDREVLFGQTELDWPAERRLEPEPRTLAFLAVVLLAVCLVLGLYPQPILAVIHEVVRGLPFVRA